MEELDIYIGPGHLICLVGDMVDGSIAVWSERAKKCVKCLEMHFFFINRGGSTRCVFCDDKMMANGEVAGVKG